MNSNKGDNNMRQIGARFMGKMKCSEDKFRLDLYGLFDEPYCKIEEFIIRIKL